MRLSAADLDGTFQALIDQPSFWGAGIVLGLFIYFWRKDVSNPQKSASESVLSGAAEHSATVYGVANQALEASLRCERRFNAIVDYTRLLQGELVKNGIQVPPWPEDALD